MHATRVLDRTTVVQEEWRVGRDFPITNKTGKKEENEEKRGHHKSLHKQNKLCKFCPLFFFFFFFRDQLSPTLFLLSIPEDH
jgi:hypothetical protein